MNRFQVKAYIKYFFKQKQRRVKDFNSPFVIEVVNRVIFEKYPYYHFSVINDIRNDLLQSKQALNVTDLGEGSKKFKNNKRTVRQLVRFNASSQKQGEIISRLVAVFKPQNIIELGTSLGIGTLYLALPNSASKVYTIEGCPKIAALARQNFLIAQANNITSKVGVFEKELPKVIDEIDHVDFVYFDGHHNYQATINYFNVCLAKASKNAIFIFDDIYWSRGMAKAWSQIKQHPSVSISFDMFRFGITFVNVEVEKQSYVMDW